MTTGFVQLPKSGLEVPLYEPEGWEDSPASTSEKSILRSPLGSKLKRIFM